MSNRAYTCRSFTVRSSPPPPNRPTTQHTRAACHQSPNRLVNSEAPSGATGAASDRRTHCGGRRGPSTPTAAQRTSGYSSGNMIISFSDWMWWSKPPTSLKLTVGTTASGSTSAGANAGRDAAAPVALLSPPAARRHAPKRQYAHNVFVRSHATLARRDAPPTRVRGKPRARALRGASAGSLGPAAAPPAAAHPACGRRVLESRAASSSDELQHMCNIPRARTPAR